MNADQIGDARFEAGSYRSPITDLASKRARLAIDDSSSRFIDYNPLCWREGDEPFILLGREEPLRSFVRGA